MKSLNLLTCLLSASRGCLFPNIIVLQVLGVPSSTLYHSYLLHWFSLWMLKQQFFPHQLSHCTLCPCHPNTLVLVEELLWPFSQPDGPQPLSLQVHVRTARWPYMQHPWKASDASHWRQRHQIIHKSKDGKGNLLVVVSHKTSPKVLMEHAQEKKQQKR